MSQWMVHINELISHSPGYFTPNQSLDDLIGENIGRYLSETANSETGLGPLWLETPPECTPETPLLTTPRQHRSNASPAEPQHGQASRPGAPVLSWPLPSWR